MKVKRPKLSEFHHGRQLFYVWVHPNKERTALEARLEEGTCMGRPWDARIYHNKISWFVHTLDVSNIWGEPTTYKNRHSLTTGNVDWNNGYNLHHFFTKRKHAQRYIDRINSGCLSAAERKHFAESLRLGRYY